MSVHAWLGGGGGRGTKAFLCLTWNLLVSTICIIPAACVGMGGNCYGDNYLNKFPITFFYWQSIPTQVYLPRVPVPTVRDQNMDEGLGMSPCLLCVLHCLLQLFPLFFHAVRRWKGQWLELILEPPTRVWLWWRARTPRWLRTLRGRGLPPLWLPSPKMGRGS